MRALILILNLIITITIHGQHINMDLFEAMAPRNIGPAGMSGRVTAIDAVVADPDVIYIGTAAGGVWKSENSGHTWTPIFEKEIASSIGSIAIFQKNPSIIYLGSGEGNPRNSQNSGRGMFKSIDGGQTWTHLGLSDTRQIHRVIIHPDNPDIVWAGISGATWGQSEERGVYKTIDGGQTWKKILYQNDITGVSDLVIDPTNPNKLIVGMWEHQRKPWTFTSGGKGSAIYITYDGGENWKKLTDKNGLPKGELGRIGLAISPTHPEIVYAYVESKINAIYRSDDGGEKWKQVSKNGDENIGDRPFYYADLYVDTKNENRVYSIASEVTVSEDGGKTWSMFASGNKLHTDHHAWWSHPDDPNYLIIGHDGGLNISHDRGKHWTFADNLPLAQFYHIRVDNAQPYNVMGGLQDNGSWRGPSRTWFKGGIRNMYWQRLSVGDGFDVIPDPLDPDSGYAMGQAGNLVRWHSPSGHLKKIKPFHPEGQHLRFNWNSGIAIDPTDQKTVYYGSQYLHKSTDHGDSWTIISPDLTTNDPIKTNFLETGGLTYDVTGAENHCTIITIDPSPLDPDIIWVGTDDGNVQLTRDGGATWQNLIKNIAGVPPNTWVTQITSSSYDRASATVVFDDHRRNNWEPYVYKTNDYGKTWKRLVDNKSIDGYTYCFVQDPIAPNLMFIGSEFGLYVSFDAGNNWNKWTAGLPTTPISDLVIHPRDHDLVIGTFGRAIWIMDDIRPLREIAQNGLETVIKANLYFFAPADEYLMIRGESIGYREGKIGDALFEGENRAFGALINYWSNDETENQLFIKDPDGRTVRTLFHKSKKGLNRTNWIINEDAPRSLREEKTDKAYRPRAGFFAAPGDYIVEIINGQDTARQGLKILPDHRLNISKEAINNKQKLIKKYNQLTTSATEIMDDIRSVEKILNIKKEILIVNETDKNDEKHSLIDTALSQILKIKESIMGKDYQGIRRDPTLLPSVIGSTGYALDHPLSPSTPNQLAQVEHLEKLIISTRNNWLAQKAKIENDTSILKNLILKE